MRFGTGPSRDLEKPIDFWLRKGKAVGETKPTEKERTLQREQNVPKLINLHAKCRFFCEYWENICIYQKKSLSLHPIGCIAVPHAHMRALRDEYTMSEVAIIQNKIYEVKGQKVMLDFELAELYVVETKALKRAVRRNIERFAGEDFMIILSPQEAEHLRSRYQNGTMNRTRGENIKYEQFAFTELGVAMLSSVLKSNKASTY